MTRIADKILDCSIYLYESADDAERGVQVGGSGFWTTIGSEVHPEISHLYAVTNHHVIRQAHAPVIRLNTADGKKHIIPLNEDDWIDHPDGDDISVCNQLGTISRETHKIHTIDERMFITPEIIQEHDIGIGDEVFLVGRFVSHEGKQRNLPTIRFGNIAMMPYEPILHPSGFWQESFLAEMRSIGGYSGSPVFVHIPSLSDRPNSNNLKATYYGPWLLGVDWGHLDTYERLRDKYNKPHPGDEGWRVKSNSGMTAIVPTWKLREHLYNTEELIMRRKRTDEEISKRKELDKGGVSLDVADMLDDVDSNFTHEDFVDALEKIVKPASEDK